MESTLSENSGIACIANSLNAITISDMLANDLLTKLEKSIGNLPKMLPDVSEADNIAVVTAAAWHQLGWLVERDGKGNVPAQGTGPA